MKENYIKQTEKDYQLEKTRRLLDLAKTRPDLFLKLISNHTPKDLETYLNRLGLEDHIISWYIELARSFHFLRESLKDNEVVLKEISNIVRNSYRILTELVDAKEKSTKDSLTGFYTKGYFNNLLEAKVGESERHSRDLSLVLIDIDDFKLINTIYGHQIGDLVIMEFARYIQEQMKRKEDIIGKVGGEEFGIIIEAKSEESEDISEELRKTIKESPIAIDENRVIRLTASFGVKEHQKKELYKELYRKTDECLSVAKALGKNRVVSYQRLLKELGDIGTEKITEEARDIIRSKTPYQLSFF